MHRAALWAAGLVSAELVYGVMTIDLTATRRQRQIEEQSRFDAISAEIGTEARALANLRSQLESMHVDLIEQRSAISALEEQIASIGSRSSKGLPRDARAKLARELKRRDILLQEYAVRSEQYRSLCADYSGRIERYNQRAKDAHVTAQKMGRQSWAVPIATLGVLGAGREPLSSPTGSAGTAAYRLGTPQ